jgi:hypothetical protein
MAFEALDKILKLKRRKGAEYVVATELVIRNSTAPLRKLDSRQKPERAVRLKAKG